MLNGLDLFSGIGGISYGLQKRVRTITYCEQDQYAQSVLLSRMQSGELDRAPIWDDVRTLSPKQFGVPIDIIFGGFPCQDISTAGNGIGLAGERSGLFFEVIRLVRELRPRFVFLENVPAIAVRGLDRVLLELTSLGYDSRWTIVSAASLGACHQRDRWFLLAHSSGESLRIKHEQKFNESPHGIKSISKQRDVTHTSCERFERKQKSERYEKKITRPCGFGGWKSQPTVGRGVDGIQNRVDRLRCLGNSVVPIQAKTAFEKLIGEVK